MSRGTSQRCWHHDKEPLRLCGGLWTFGQCSRGSCRHIYGSGGLEYTARPQRGAVCKEAGFLLQRIGRDSCISRGKLANPAGLYRGPGAGCGAPARLDQNRDNSGGPPAALPCPRPGSHARRHHGVGRDYRRQSEKRLRATVRALWTCVLDE